LIGLFFFRFDILVLIFNCLLAQQKQLLLVREQRLTSVGDGGVEGRMVQCDCRLDAG
jgi:hypothetical protein